MRAAAKVGTGTTEPVPAHSPATLQRKNRVHIRTRAAASSRAATGTALLQATPLSVTRLSPPRGAGLPAGRDAPPRGGASGPQECPRRPGGRGVAWLGSHSQWGQQEAEWGWERALRRQNPLVWRAGVAGRSWAAGAEARQRAAGSRPGHGGNGHSVALGPPLPGGGSAAPLWGGR